MTIVDVYVGDQPRPATAEVQAVDEEFMAAHLRPGDWVSIRVEGVRVLVDRRDLAPDVAS